MRSAQPASGPEAERYVYGLRVRGLGGVPELAPVPPLDAAEPAHPGYDGPAITVGQFDTEPPDPVPVDERRSVRVLADGRHLALDRHRRTATFFGPPLSPDLLAHPYLGPVATTFSRWAGREAFHAGAFVSTGRAWAVLGPRTAGKSTLLASMAQRGTPVLTDDILVVDGSVGYAGPRCVDLRQPLPGGRSGLAPVRAGTRLRVPLPPIPPWTGLGGWIFLRWGDQLGLTPVAPRVLLGRLASRRSAAQLPSDPTTMLAIATLPAWDLVRPRSWRHLDRTHRLLAETLPGSAPPAAAVARAQPGLTA